MLGVFYHFSFVKVVLFHGIRMNAELPTMNTKIATTSSSKEGERFHSTEYQLACIIKFVLMKTVEGISD